MGIDLASPTFWLATVLAIAVLLPTARNRRAFVAIAAGLNLAFVAAVLRERLSGGIELHLFDLGAFVLVPLVLFWLGLKAVGDAVERGGRRPHAGLGVALTIGAAVLAAFVAHKRPDLGPARVGDLTPVLAVIGLSYVALRAIDVLVAVAQGRIAAPGLPALVGYLLPFHMLAAGPIAAAEDALANPSRPAPDLADALAAAERIASGLFKKYVVAQTIHEVFLTGFAADGAYAWLEVQLFYLWVYLDFSAYSDIAVGVGRLIGVPTPENFDRPLTARNLIQFWERWHITLGAFARRNLFVPIQLALVRRRPADRLLAGSVALAITFVAIGLWHGLTWGFFAWGAMHAAGVVTVNLYRAALTRRLGKKRAQAFARRPLVRVVATALTFEYVAVSLMLVEVAWRT